MKILSNRVITIVRYGRLKVETRLGELEYSYSLEGDNEPYFQLESGQDILETLTDNEQDEVYELINEELIIN
jgi:hypothetical protein